MSNRGLSTATSMRIKDSILIFPMSRIRAWVYATSFFLAVSCLLGYELALAETPERKQIDLDLHSSQFKPNVQQDGGHIDSTYISTLPDGIYFVSAWVKNEEVPRPFNS